MNLDLFCYSPLPQRKHGNYSAISDEFQLQLEL